MFDSLFTFIYSELGFHCIVEEDEDKYLMGMDPAIGEDFSGRI
jgi:hypothetical protein